MHEGAPKAKTETKPQPKAAAKAAVATLLASSVRGAEASRTNMTSMGKTFDMFGVMEKRNANGLKQCKSQRYI